MKLIELNCGHLIPPMGLGTADPMYGVPISEFSSSFLGRVFRKIYHILFRRIQRLGRSVKFVFAVRKALLLGYRMIDTSASYNNEKLIRWGIRLSGISREEIFLVTRVSNRQQWNGDIRSALKISLQNLGVEYVDLYMFHWPVPDAYIKTWHEMEKLYEEGLAKSIGVANCHQHHLEALLGKAKVVPVINQFEVHPLMSQNPLVDFCKAKGIQVVSYTPIARYHEKLVQNERLREIAGRCGKSCTQIVLRWHLQRGLVTVPRSTNFSHLKSNFDIFDFELSDADMLLIDSMNEDLRLRFDPDNCDFSKL